MERPETKNAIHQIAGTSKRGALRIAARNIGVTYESVRRWSAYGIPEGAIIKVWKAGGMKADLLKLAMEAV